MIVDGSPLTLSKREYGWLFGFGSSIFKSTGGVYISSRY
jgi:hypothetical protein